MGRQVVREVVIPYSPREQFQAFHDRQERWAVIVAHRRAGKTVACVNDLIRAAATSEKHNPRYAYIAPLFNQAKDAAWSYLKEFTDPIPGREYNETELRTDFPNGGRVRLYGADNPDRLRGIYLDGVILDEFGDMNPRMWTEVVRPALSDRLGWAVFIGTPKGRNAFCDLWEDAGKDAEWYRLMLKASETGIVASDELAAALKMMGDDRYRQEYECSFDAAMIGSYYGSLIEQAENDKRIGVVPWEPLLPVHTAWDLGLDDATCIWFFQVSGQQIRVIDYYEASGADLTHYVKHLDKKPYKYGDHVLPHDVKVRELGADSARSRLETLQSLGMRSARALTNQRVEDGINAVRLVLPRCWFDRDKCEPGLKALRQYHREWDDDRKTFGLRPYHDWSSHAADAFRYLAVGLNSLPDAAWNKKPDYSRLNRGIV